MLIFCDLALLAFGMLVPNLFFCQIWLTAFQCQFGGFSYFNVLLAAATMAYSWRTIIAFGTWTTGLWLKALILVSFLGTKIPALSEKIAIAFVGYEGMLDIVDPNDLHVPDRMQEIAIFLIVAGILALNGKYTSRLLIRQAGVARKWAHLARHFLPNLVDRIAERNQPLRTVCSQVVTVMFVDIAGFAAVAEWKPPDDVVALLREFQQRMESAVFDHHGILDKFLGDGLMAAFGTPDLGANDASNALRCSRAMLTEIDIWNREPREAGKEPIRALVRIHYGMDVLGDIGPARRLEYAVLGGTVNVANRLEELTGSLGVQMAMSDDFVMAVRDYPGTEAGALLSDPDNGGLQSVRGREEPIVVRTL